MRPLLLLQRIVAGLGVASLFACSRPPEPNPRSSGRFEVQGQRDLEQIRAALLAPQQLPRVVWRQSLEIEAQGKAHHLEAIVQNDGVQFQVLGLGPGGMKLFLVTQDRTGVTARVFVDRPLSLSPEYLLFDIQRALFWKPESACTPPESSWSFRGFSVEDSCLDTGVKKRIVSDGPTASQHSTSQHPTSQQSASHLTITYEDTFDFQNPPSKVILRHEKRGYRITMTQLESHTLP